MKSQEFHAKDLGKVNSSLQADMDLDRIKARLKQQERDAAESIKRYEKIQSRAAAEDRIVEDFADGLAAAFESGRLKIQIAPPVTRKHKGKKDMESAVLVISDSHIGKVVKRSSTLEFGHYNLKVFLDRLFYIEQSVSRLMSQNIVNPIRKLHICFLGDIVEGQLSHAQEAPQRNYASDQVLIASIVLYQFVARLSRVVDIECHAVVGNHGRWPNQKKMPTEGRFSNFDMIVMGQVSQLLAAAGPKNVTFHINDQPFQIVDIEGWRFKMGHGDHLKGGDKAVGVPAHSIGREINATVQRYAARGEKVPDFYQSEVAGQDKEAEGDSR